MGRKFIYEPNTKGYEEIKKNHFIICFDPQVEPYRQHFLCCVCNKIITRFIECLSHCNSSKHKKEVAGKWRKLQSFACQKCHTQAQLSNFTAFCQWTVLKNNQALTKEDHNIRLEILKRVGKTLHNAGLKGASVSLYGSSDTLLGFKYSDVNLHITLKNFNKLDPELGVTDVSSLFWHSHEALSKSDQFSDFEQHFARKYAEFIFKDKESGCTCTVKLQVDPLLKSHDLIKKYVTMDERVNELFMLIKTWCKTIGVCNREAGGIPSFNLLLLTLHYLQQTNPPVIPVIKTGNVVDLNERVIIDAAQEKNFCIDPHKVPSWKSENTEDVGKLWLGWMRFYISEFSRKALVVNIRQHTPLSRSHKEFASRRFAIEDPYNLKENISKYASNAVVGYFLDSIEVSYKYFTSYCQCKGPRLRDYEIFDQWNKAPSKGKVEPDTRNERSHKEPQETSDESDSLKKRVRYVSTEDSGGDVDDDVIFESGSEAEESEDDAEVGGKEEEDFVKIPANEKENENENENENDETSQQQTSSSEGDFVKITSTDQTDTNADTDKANEPLSPPSEEGSSVESFVEVDGNSSSSLLEAPKQSLQMPEDEMVSVISDAIGEIVEPTKTQDIQDTELNEIVEKIINLPLDDNDANENRDTSKPENVPISSDSGKTGSRQNSCTQEIMKYEFKVKHLRPKMAVPLYCRECCQDGHTFKDCPHLNVDVPTLPAMTGDFLKKVDEVCLGVMSDMELKPHEFEIRMKVLQELEAYLKLNYKKDCQLVLFGSSVNGFGSSGSDLDICLLFKSNQEQPPDVDSVDVIKHVQKALERQAQYHKVYAIKTSKVPIVKFCVNVHPKQELEGDISFYNTLAIHNSTMLSTYALIDYRVRALGYCLKVFAKRCEIGDASRGSLSSYAYILLLLFYLQRCSPPVIPVLQELYDRTDEKKPERMVEGCNTWFFNDVPSLKEKWDGVGKNTQSTGELFIGFFRFYIEEFDFLKLVVAPKQTKPLYKYEKSWNSAIIAIEDPFLLRHNLGAGISRNMFHFIRQCFIKARSHFGDSTRSVPNTKNVKVLQDNFFNPHVILGDERVPTNRLCRRCGRIGHIAANCAEKVAIDRDRRRVNSENEQLEDNKQKHQHQPQDIRDIRDRNDDGGDPQTPKDKSRFYKCPNCRQQGHRRQDCPKKRGGRGDRADPNDMVCYHCNKKGHQKRSCPEYERTCHECGEKGHVKSKCPRLKNQSGYSSDEGRHIPRGKSFEDSPIIDRPSIRSQQPTHPQSAPQLKLQMPARPPTPKSSLTPDRSMPNMQFPQMSPVTPISYTHQQLNDLFKPLENKGVGGTGIFPPNSKFVPPQNMPNTQGSQPFQHMAQQVNNQQGNFDFKMFANRFNETRKQSPQQAPVGTPPPPQHHQHQSRHRGATGYQDPSIRFSSPQGGHQHNRKQQPPIGHQHGSHSNNKRNNGHRHPGNKPTTALEHELDLFLDRNNTPTRENVRRTLYDDEYPTLDDRPNPGMQQQRSRNNSGNYPHRR
ncbi:terminal uridylyltransferase 7-like [Clytia hemisphaerica]|uniref:CCHC-type domain-containing protein n=1 Tax=Clytia hemisphaerica TaxID=252671 RepID=A0A7M5WQK2_9CNID